MPGLFVFGLSTALFVTQTAMGLRHGLAPNLAETKKQILRSAYPISPCETGPQAAALRMTPQFWV
jgi:hypothetical protein